MEAVKIFISLLVITNPIGNIPFFISLTQHQNDVERKNTIRTTAMAVAIVLIITGVVGEKVIELFGISIASFRVGGGILVLLMAISMLNSPQRARTRQQTPEEREEAEHKSSVAIFPLTIPLLAGPGAISTVIIEADRAVTWYQYTSLIVSSMLVGAVVWIMFRLAVPISHLLGQSGINIATRIMGLLLSAIAVEYMVQGLKGLIPVLNAVSIAF